MPQGYATYLLLPDKTLLNAVHQLDGVVEVFCDLNDGDWPERFVVHDSRVTVCPHDGRCHAVAGERSTGENFAALLEESFQTQAPTEGSVLEGTVSRAGDQLRVTERYRLINENLMNYEATIEDAKTFSRPWKIVMPLYRRQEKNMQLLEFKCVEFVEELMYGQWRKKPLPR